MTQRKYAVMEGGTIICETGKAPRMYADCLGHSVEVGRAWAADTLCKWRNNTRIASHQPNAPYKRRQA